MVSVEDIVARTGVQLLPTSRSDRVLMTRTGYQRSLLTPSSGFRTLLVIHRRD